MRKERRNFIPKALSTLLCVSLLFSLFSTKIFAEDNYLSVSSDRIGEGDAAVTLTKEAYWNNYKNKATVELTFNGLEQVKSSTDPVDVLMVLDNSRSMWSDQVNCLNETHRTCPEAHLVNGTEFGLMFPELIKLNDNNGNITPLWTKYMLPAITAAVTANTIDSTATTIDPQFQLPITFTGLESHQYVLVPSDGINMNLLAANWYKSYSNWQLVDLSVSLTEYDYWALVDGGHSAYAAQCLMCYGYHVDKDNHRLGHQLTNGKWTGDGGTQHSPLQTNDCRFYADELREAAKDFATAIVADGESRVAFAAFNTNARTDDSNGFLPFTSNASTAKTAIDTALGNYGGRMTNYESGFASAQAILASDASYQTAGYKRKLAIVFFTDGASNRTCTWPEGVTSANASATQLEEAAKTNNTADTTAAGNAGKTALQAITTNYAANSPVVYVVNHNVGNTAAKTLLSSMASKDKYYETNYQDETLKKTIEDIFDSVTKEVATRTKIVTVSDLIDNAYFTVESDKLTTNDRHDYFPEYAKVKIETLNKSDLKAAAKISANTVQKVTFTYTADADQEEVESVLIPILLNTDANANDTDGFVPTNYDPTGTGGGAVTNYTDLTGTNQTIDTVRVWLPTGGIKVIKKDVTSGEELNGAEFELYNPDGTKYSDTVYTTAEVEGENGTFTRTTLPPVDLYLKEITAPKGYQLPSGNDAITEFSIDEQTPKIVEVVVENTKKVTPPDTGDDNNLFLYICLLSVSAGAIYVASIINRKKEQTIIG